MCDLLAHPERTEILNPRPRLSWIVNSNIRDDLQTAYQVQLAPTRDAIEEGRGLVWDSGKVASDHSSSVHYGGPELRPQSDYWWRVRTWDRSGRPSGWSAPQGVRTRFSLQATAAQEDRTTVARYPLVTEPILPTSVTPTSTGLFLDFGRDAYGGLRLTLGASAPGSVRVHLGEKLAGPSRIDRKPPGSVRYYTTELKLRPGRHAYVVPLLARDFRRLPEGVGPAMPFRYVEVQGYAGSLKREDAQQLAVHYPFDDNAARFACSDKTLNAVWELCRYSMKATSAFGLYVDGDRERLPYEADAYINQLGHYAVDREFTLARYTHEYLIQHATWPTEWLLHSVLIAWADYLYTGDDASLRLFYDDLKAKTLRSLEREDGLISSTAVRPEVLEAVHSTRMQDIVDWPAGERDGYEMRPVNTVVNCFHYRALELMAKIAAALGNTADSDQFRRDASRVAREINAKLADPATGFYVDGEGSSHSSLHANMFPLAFGLVPSERRKAVVAFVRSRGMACSVYGAQYLLEALFESGQAEYAVGLMTAPGDRSWAHWVRDVGTTIALEAWDQKYKPNQDWNHAWGAAPANIIPRKLMGIEPLEPGFRRVRIRPQIGGLQWASIDLPTIRGTIRETVRKLPNRLVIELTLPANVTAEVQIESTGQVRLDGKFCKASVRDGYLVIEPVGSGVHRVEVIAASPGGR